MALNAVQLIHLISKTVTNRLVEALVCASTSRL
jgi:hypothetical protein